MCINILKEVVEYLKCNESMNMDSIRTLMGWIKNSPEKVFNFLDKEIPEESRKEFILIFFRFLIVHSFCEPDDGLLNTLLYEDEERLNKEIPFFGGQEPREFLLVDFHVPRSQFYSPDYFLSLIDFDGRDNEGRDVKIPPNDFLPIIEGERYNSWLTRFYLLEEKIFTK